MKRAIGFSFGLLLVGIACLAQAQVPMTGAGKGTPAASLPTCAGTAIHLTNPNALASAPWQNFNLTLTNNNATAPDTTATASTAVSFNTTNFGELVYQPLASSTGGVTYSVSAYLKSIVAPAWVVFIVSDNVANNFGRWINLAGGGAIGGSEDGGDGVTSCANVSNQGSGWVYVSIAGSFTSTHTPTSVNIFLCDANNTCGGTVNQEIAAWQVGP